MRKRRLAFVGLGPDTASACLSMLKIMDGRSSVGWTQTDPEEADVLVMPSSDNAQTRPWKNTEKPCILVYPSSEKRPAAPFTLPHPFRVMQLLGVLEEVAKSLGGLQETETEKVSTPATGMMDFGYSLQQALKHSQNADDVYLSQSEYGPVFVIPRTGCYYTPLALLKQLRQQQLTLPALQAATQPLPDNLVRRPIFELAWYTAQFAPKPLGSWIEAGGLFKLKRWPNFGIVRGNRTHLSLCALLTRQPLSREAMQSQAHCSEDELDRFLTACDMAGLLTCDIHSPVPAANPEWAHTEGRFGGLIRGLRSRLGLSG